MILNDFSFEKVLQQRSVVNQISVLWAESPEPILHWWQ